MQGASYIYKYILAPCTKKELGNNRLKQNPYIRIRKQKKGNKYVYQPR
ncbi:hypothetical protein M107_1283 [Bacteroides fragilis str. 3725 D9(v)]|nr:hypothetical protein M107_1283 [Bacteroides fragilis str. 3725 D9(v)]KDS15262.1 hypothetical protein M088_1403 [Bacteroides ovatus str. 3725 D1 iv]KDS16407.1 hypothetical protein M082_4636 [Bacteroides fragilis str. 3725 D9 ii]KDS23107.1 hypothetical protein M089_4960 [Bacteroides ovatus str. 3725 D9 iii]